MLDTLHPDPEALSSPPPRNTRERRLPSITPRKFTRFFTPRSNASSIPSSSQRALDIITSSDARRNGSGPLRSRTLAFDSIVDQENADFTRGLKRRKLYQSPEPSPAHTYEQDSKYLLVDDLMQIEPDSSQEIAPSSPCERATQYLPQFSASPVLSNPAPKPIRRMKGLSAQVLERELGVSSSYEEDGDWAEEAAHFYSRRDMSHDIYAVDDAQRRVIPFCTAGLNTNSLIAIGDEEGTVRLLESNVDDSRGFSDAYLSFRVHTNAVIDMQFSKDDSRLATASGDQSARVVDMATQTILRTFGSHTASLKQVRFQPGANNNDVLATSSRDGCVHVWDMRTRAGRAPERAHNILPGMSDESWGRPVQTIYDAHKWSHSPRGDSWEYIGKTGDVSVTAMSFLAQGHLIVTGCEVDATIKLWDLRSLQSKPKNQFAVSETAKPTSHTRIRNFGTSSITLGGDGSRLYSLCKDNTIYAYSTAHLILGHAPELSQIQPSRRFAPKETKHGLGPLHGYRHPELHASSFYVKTALRPAKDGKCEMLAVGSSNGRAFLFPTDERYLGRDRDTLAPDDEDKTDDDLMISTRGSVLVHGHDPMKEVGSLAWSSEGNLVTLGDDYLARLWSDERLEKRKRQMQVSLYDAPGGPRMGWAMVRGWKGDPELGMEF